MKDCLTWPLWHTKMHFSAKCNSGRIAIQWYHIKHYLDYQYTKFQPYTFRVQKNMCFCTIRDFGSPTKTKVHPIYLVGSCTSCCIIAMQFKTLKQLSVMCRFLWWHLDQFIRLSYFWDSKMRKITCGIIFWTKWPRNHSFFECTSSEGSNEIAH